MSNWGGSDGELPLIGYMGDLEHPIDGPARKALVGCA